MKNIFTILIVLLGMRMANAQDNSVFVDSILNLVVTNQISVFDKNLEKIDNYKIKLLNSETVINDQWTRPKFIDNIFYGAFDGVLSTSPIIFDTSTNRINDNYLEFKTVLYDRYGFFLTDTVSFLIDKREKRQEQVYKLPKQFRKLKNTIWQNKDISIGGKAIELDSCSLGFRLELHEDFTFRQYYGEYASSCSTEEMAEHIEVGVEDDAGEYSKYYHGLQGHYIEASTGVWQVENKKLYLMSKEGRKVISFELLHLSEEELELGLTEHKYLIKLKKARH